MLASQDLVSQSGPSSLARAALTIERREQPTARSGQKLVRAITHEIRSPLTVILAYASAILEHRSRLTAAEVAHLMRGIESSARLVSVIVDDLETLAARASIRFQPTLLDVKDFLADVAPELQALAPGRELQLRLPSEPLFVFCDPLRLRQVLANLVKNGHRHSRPGGAVFIELTGLNGDVLVIVEDEGPGVPAEELDRIFEPFYRVAGARDVQGAGLGLAICRLIVERQGGRIRASAGRRGGLRAEITLPTAARMVRQMRLDETPSRFLSPDDDGMGASLPEKVPA